MLGLCQAEATGWRQMYCLELELEVGQNGEKQSWKDFVCQQVMDGH